MSPFRRHQQSAPRPSEARFSEKSPARTVRAALLLPGLLLLLVGLQGCSALTHYNAVRDLDGVPGERTEVLLMDAKQRGAYLIRSAEMGPDNKVVKSFQHFCAEPSPDALSNLAAQFGATVSVVAKGEGSINGGFSEGAANIGLRTQSIQLLRDITYRQCEAYANGGISKLGLETLQRRFQSTMVALLSIEQLTGAVRAPAVVLAGKAAGSDAELIASLTEKTIAARAAVTKSENEVAAKDKDATSTAAKTKTVKNDYDTEKAGIDALRKQSPAAGSADKKKVDDFDAAKPAKEKAVADAEIESTKAAAELAAAKTSLNERKETLEAQEAARLAALAAGGQASTSAEIKPIVVPGALSGDSAKALAEAVTSIVHDTLALGFGREVCTSIIGDQTDPSRALLTSGNAAADAKVSSNAGLVLGACLDLLKEDITYYKSVERGLDARSKQTDALTGLIESCAREPTKCALAPETMIELIKNLQPPTSTPPLMVPFQRKLPG